LLNAQLGNDGDRLSGTGLNPGIPALGGGP